MAHVKTNWGRRGLIAASGLIFGASVAAAPADAGGRHRRHHQMHRYGQMQGEAIPKRAPIPYAYSYYPEEIEGGVSGNLPFNNQIRKFKDPLNANGGGG